MNGDDRLGVTPIAIRRITSSAWVIAGICVLMTLAARTTGAGWLVVIMCLLAGAFLVGISFPHLSLIALRATATAPSDAVAGRPTDIHVAVGRARLGLLLRLPAGDWRASLDGSPVPLTLVPSQRGRYDSVDVEVCCGAPFGLSWSRRRLRVPLRAPMIVAPRTQEQAVSPTDEPDVDGDSPNGGRPRDGDQLRSVRDYVLGDPLRLVHWPATARRGELIVKELEAPARRHLHVEVILGGGAEIDERTCERAMGVVTRAIADGLTVTLATAGPDGPHLGHIAGRLDAGRQLAVAGAGRLPIPTTATGTHRVQLRSAGG